MTEREALRLALKALEINLLLIEDFGSTEQLNAQYKAITAIYEALAQRTWVGLTDEEKKDFWTADQMTQQEWDELFTAIEAKLKEKNSA